MPNHFESGDVRISISTRSEAEIPQDIMRVTNYSRGGRYNGTGGRRDGVGNKSCFSTCDDRNAGASWNRRGTMRGSNRGRGVRHGHGRGGMTNNGIASTARKYVKEIVGESVITNDYELLGYHKTCSDAAIGNYIMEKREQYKLRNYNVLKLPAFKNGIPDFVQEYEKIKIRRHIILTKYQNELIRFEECGTVLKETTFERLFSPIDTRIRKMMMLLQ